VQGVGNFVPIFATKLVAMVTSLKISEKEGWIDHLPFSGAKIVKIGPVDTALALLIVKKNKEKKKKLSQSKYIALPASLPSGLKNRSHDVTTPLSWTFVISRLRLGAVHLRNKFEIFTLTITKI